MANLPEQIQRQVDAAQALMAKQTEAPKAEEGETTTSEAPATTPPTEAVAPVKAQEQTQTEDENSLTYAQRWRSLQGIMASEKNRNAQLEAQIQQLQALVSNLQTAPVTGMANKQFLTEADTTEFGPEMVDVMRRAAREELKDFAGAVGALKNDLDGLRQVVPTVQRLTQETELTAQERFFNALGQAVPDYEQVNANQQFKQWLLTPDPMTGILRQTYLVDAQRAGDVGRVATIFNAWKSLSGTQGQTTTRPDTRKELERQQAPGRTLSAPATENKGRIWDPREISALYAEKTRGKWAGREAEFKALEQDIFKAQQEGRIVRQAA